MSLADHTTYNAMGWVTAVSEWYDYGDTAPLTTFTNFDPFGRAGAVTKPDGKVVTFGFSGVRRVARATSVATSSSSETTATTTETYDRQGRLYRVEEPSGSGGALVTTTYAYDVGNRLTGASTTSGVTQVRTFAYDRRGLLLSEDLPEKTPPSGFAHDVTYSSYDARGHAGRVVDGPSDLTFSYDKAERVTKIAVTDGSSLADFAYDKLGGVAQGSSLGKLVQATRHNWVGSTDNQVVESYTYSGTGGRVSARTTTVDGKTFDQGFLWNQLGALGIDTYPMVGGGGTLLRTGPNRTVQYRHTNGFLTAVPGFASSISYHPNMMVDQITLGNGVAVSEGLDSSGMPRVASIATSGASPNWSSGAYAYDGAGNVKSTGTLYFVYDEASRLTSGDVKVGGATKTQTAAYDAFGNITSTETTDWGTQSFSLDASTNRLSSPATYDAAGHLQSWGGYSYAYNAAGQLLTATGASVNHTYLYTASGERIADRNFLNNTTTLALRGLDGKLLRLYSETGTTGHGAMSWLEDQVWGAGRLLGTVSPTEGRRYYAADHLGTPRLACDRCKDATAQHAYYPFGLEATDPTQDAETTRFTSHETDLQSTPGQADDLVNMHARFYHPTLARFLSADLLRGNPHSPQSFNLFAYVRGNPTSFWDPLGLDASQDPLNPFKWWDILDVIGIDPWRIAAEGWQSRDDFMNGKPTYGLDEGGGGGVMERLARQPKVAGMNDVLDTMNSFECDASWNRVFQNMATTNSLGLRAGGFRLLGANSAATRVAETLTGTNVAAELGLPTVRQFVFGGLRGLTIEGVSFTGIEAGVLTGTGVGASFVFTSAAWQTGVFVGSVLNVAATAPCHYGH